MPPVALVISQANDLSLWNEWLPVLPLESRPIDAEYTHTPTAEHVKWPFTGGYLAIGIGENRRKENAQRENEWMVFIIRLIM